MEQFLKTNPNRRLFEWSAAAVSTLSLRLQCSWQFSQSRTASPKMKSTLPLDVAILAVDAAVALRVEGVLIADEATVVEDGAVAVGSDGHGLIP